MRNAPPVQWPVGRCHIGAWLAAGLVGLGLTLTAFWAWQAPGWRPLAGLLAWLGFAVLAWRRAVPPTGVLSWDGEGWHWWADGDPAGNRPVTSDLALDLQRVLLVRLASGSRCVWLWLTPSGDIGRWLTLRRALYSRRIRKVG